MAVVNKGQHGYVWIVERNIVERQAAWILAYPDDILSFSWHFKKSKQNQLAITVFYFQHALDADLLQETCFWNVGLVMGTKSYTSWRFTAHVNNLNMVQFGTGYLRYTQLNDLLL